MSKLLDFSLPQEYEPEFLDKIHDQRTCVLERGIIVECEYCNGPIWVDEDAKNDSKWLLCCDKVGCMDKATMHLCGHPIGSR